MICWCGKEQTDHFNINRNYKMFSPTKLKDCKKLISTVILDLKPNIHTNIKEGQ